MGIARKTGEWVEWMVEVYGASLRVCKGLVAFVVGHGKGARQWSAGPALLCAELVRAGINLRSPCIYRRNGIMGSGGIDWLRADFEWVVCATRGGKLPWADNLAKGTPPKYPAGGLPSHQTKNGRVNKKQLAQDLGAGVRKTPDGKHYHKKIEGGALISRGGVYVPPEKTNPGNVIDCVVGGGHLGSKIAHENEAPFPDKLPDFFVHSFCPPGGTVLDPFAGSGTTLAEALKAGRKFVGIDLRPSQIELCKKRIKQARRQKGLFEL